MIIGNAHVAIWNLGKGSLPRPIGAVRRGFWGGFWGRTGEYWGLQALIDLGRLMWLYSMYFGLEGLTIS